MEKAAEPKKEDAKTEEIKKKEEEEDKVEIPVVAEPKTDYLFAKLKSKNSLTNILSFLPIKDLVEVTKANRYVYKIVMNEETRKKNILKWDFTFEEEQLLNTFLTDLTNENSVYDEKLKKLIGEVKIGA
jgi:hypothetical protein